MKRMVTLLMAALLALSLAGCSFVSTTKPTDTASTTTTAGDATTTAEDKTTAADTTETTAQTAVPLNETVRSLMKINIRCVTELFELKQLPYNDKKAVSGNSIYEVTSTEFPTLQSLRTYLLTAYTKEAADGLLNDIPHEGSQLYCEVNGKLCIDASDAAILSGRGYFVDWSSFSVEILSESDTSCKFAVTAAITEPGDNPQAEPYRVEGSMEKGADGWRLVNRIL